MAQARVLCWVSNSSAASKGKSKYLCCNKHRPIEWIHGFGTTWNITTWWMSKHIGGWQWMIHACVQSLRRNAIYMYILQYFLKTAKCSIRTSTYIYNITVMLVSSSCCANHTQKRNEQIEIQRGATSLSGCLQLLACRVVAKTKRLILTNQ